VSSVFGATVTVGPTGDYATLELALAAIDPYDVIELEETSHDGAEIDVPCTIRPVAGFTESPTIEASSDDNVVYVTSDDVTLEDLTILGTDSARCIAVGWASGVGLTNITVDGCASQDGDGGHSINIQSSNVWMQNLVATDPTGTDSDGGGHLRISNSVVAITSSQFVNGTAQSGAAIWMTGSYVDIDNTQVEMNDSQLGGAIYAEDNPSLNLSVVSFLDNVAGSGEGTDLFLDESTANVQWSSASASTDSAAYSLYGYLSSLYVQGYSVVNLAAAKLVDSEVHYVESTVCTEATDVIWTSGGSVQLLNSVFYSAGSGALVRTDHTDVVVTNSVFVGARPVEDVESIAIESVGDKPVDVINSVFSGFGTDLAVPAITGGSLNIGWSLFYEVEGTHDGEEVAGTIVEEDPEYENLSWLAGECGGSLVHTLDSPLVDAGSPLPEFLDIDGTRNDIGHYGGNVFAEPDEDEDGDGFVGLWDCLPDNPDAHVGMAEVCNDGVDNDCDPSTNDTDASMWYLDADGDGFGDENDAGILSCDDESKNGYSGLHSDCADDNEDTHRLAADACNGADENCNGANDDDLRQQTAYWDDLDDDGYGMGHAWFPVLFSCEQSVDGYADNLDDCHDGDDRLHPQTWWGPDLDGDDWGESANAVQSCESPDADYTSEVGDCDDDDDDVNPDAQEQCDQIDWDCDGEKANGLSSQFLYLDDDDDGYGDPKTELETCEPDIIGFVTNGDDCNDNLKSVHPGKAESCNDRDDDCNDFVDDGVGTIWYVDGDVDGFYGTEILSCDAPDSATSAEPLVPDCDDANDKISPSSPELCNGVDDDCDGVLDNGLPVVLYCYDGDGDGDGDPTGADVYEACAPFDDATDSCGDCDEVSDKSDQTYAGAVEVCGNKVDENCDGWDPECTGTDDDGDGYCGAVACGDCSLPGDCNDADADIHPGAQELCNSIDDDCDGLLDEVVDLDGDGTPGDDPCSPSDLDCNDLLASVFPNAPELCDLLDNDCDGVVDDTIENDDDDDGVPGGNTCGDEVDCNDGDPTVGPQFVEVPANSLDDDCDGHVDESSDPQAVDDDHDGYCERAPCDDGALSGDCDDSDPTISPGQIEVADGLDNDCDGEVDDLDVAPVDADHDGVAPDENDCNDASALVGPSAEEMCNGLDDNCDGVLPEEELDLDGDGWTPCEGDCDDAEAEAHPTHIEVCLDGIDNDCNTRIDDIADDDDDGVRTTEGDCNDKDATVSPREQEECNGIDDNCDGQVDEAFDIDGDGFLSCDFCSVTPCDCDDSNPNRYPGNREHCADGIDNDCDGLVDVGDPDIEDNDGWDVCSGDCAPNQKTISPESLEQCDGVDNNCNGLVDETFDQDGDGVSRCRGDCDDADPTVFQMAEELCDGVDNNCDGTVDEGYEDVDKDGVLGCLECDDNDDQRSPDLAEHCADNIDNDCDGLVDELDDDCSGPDTGGSALGGAPAASPGWFCGTVPSGYWMTVVIALGALRRKSRPKDSTKSVHVSHPLL
jgi:hypothetical protein